MLWKAWRKEASAGYSWGPYSSLQEAQRMRSQPRPPGDTRLGVLGERVSEGCGIAWGVQGRTGHAGAPEETGPLLVARGAGAEATA